jgi:hypothetical protein
MWNSELGRARLGLRNLKYVSPDPQPPLFCYQGLLKRFGT